MEGFEPMDGRGGRRCTYRVQLNRSFTFDDAAGKVDYLAELGISHIYCSPILAAAPGSTHGYDVVDHSRLNPELGGQAGLARLARAVQTAGMALVIDIVPNHMALAGRANNWWWDVLGNGPGSAYARYFDINWEPREPEQGLSVLMPVLGDHYGRAIEAGDVRIVRVGGAAVVRCHDHEAPLAAEDAKLSDEDLEVLNADPDALDALLRRQHYRLCFWKVASEELDYRRFFSIDTLVGLRVEEPRVFDDTHHLILKLVADGTIDGLRVDHIDGLAEPKDYLERLAEASGGAYVVVEKILEPGENLPSQWPVAGSTGYDFLAVVNALLVDPDGEAALTAAYQRFTGDADSYDDVVRASKRTVIDGELAAEVDSLVRLLAETCEAHRRQRDHTRRELREALSEVMVSFDVYRTYAEAYGSPGPDDCAALARAVERARVRRPDIDQELLGFIGEVLGMQHRDPPAPELARRFQQVSAPVMAKGVEDTAFYRYNRLISLNEVGGDPGSFGIDVDHFHRFNQYTADHWPETMLTLSTHDTKRGADVRARLNLLSEMAPTWSSTIDRWSLLMRRHRRGGQPGPDAEYLLYQTLVGAWPIDSERVVAFMVKAAREAKVHTSWRAPQANYEERLEAFVRAVMSDQSFVSDLEAFLADRRLVDLGLVNSLTQVALLLTCPGIPDIYQGSEVADTSLVDPDNRRPVDYGLSRRLLATLPDSTWIDAPADPDGEPDPPWWITQGVSDRFGPGAKLWLTRRLLRHRLGRPECYSATSGYRPLVARGREASRAVAFARRDLCTVVPRLVGGLSGGWADTAVELPAGEWVDVLTGQGHGAGWVPLRQLSGTFPVAVLEATN